MAAEIWPAFLPHNEHIINLGKEGQLRYYGCKNTGVSARVAPDRGDFLQSGASSCTMQDYTLTLLSEWTEPAVPGKCRKESQLLIAVGEALKRESILQLTSKVEKRGITVCSQPPERCWHNFAAAIPQHQGKPLHRLSSLFERVLPPAKACMIVAIFRMHMSGNATVAGVAVERRNKNTSR